MSEQQKTLQFHFIDKVCKSKSAVTVFLVNGVKLQGNITWFDDGCLLLKKDQFTQIVYMHSISTILPVEPVPFSAKDC
jgi:host factor-I protein